TSITREKYGKILKPLSQLKEQIKLVYHKKEPRPKTITVSSAECKHKHKGAVRPSTRNRLQSVNTT
ncbi:hypothetical protein C0J52_06848, partial [Blattella germanica]